jgi:hypothetical protein
MERVTKLTENEEIPTLSPAPKRTRKPLEAYTPGEQAIIRWVERGKGRELTAQEVHLGAGAGEAHRYSRGGLKEGP